MAEKNYWVKNDLFSFEDEVDDETFLKHPSTGSSGYMLSNSRNQYEPSHRDFNPNDDLEEKRQQLLMKKKEIEQRTVQSTQRSLSYLRNSEEVGIATAEELMRQREQLERTEKRLDNINTTLRFSQKHIQGIKSVFGGLRNLLGGKSDRALSGTSKTDGESLNKTSLDHVLDKSSSSIHEIKQNSVHPGLRVRGLDEQSNYEPSGKENSMEAQQVIDQNLDEMLGTITRLKGLAHGLGEEIESQNDIIENVIDKTERADDSIQKQNKDITRLLK